MNSSRYPETRLVSVAVGDMFADFLEKRRMWTCLLAHLQEGSIYRPVKVVVSGSCPPDTYVNMPPPPVLNYRVYFIGDSILISSERLSGHHKPTELVGPWAWVWACHSIFLPRYPVPQSWTVKIETRQHF